MSEDYETLCRPSLWSKKHPNREAVIQHFLDFADRKSELSSNSKHDLKVSYGESDREKLDIYYPESITKKYVIVYIHGGYWQEGNKDMYKFVANNFINDGFIYVNVGYNLAPAVTIQEINKEITKAVKFIANKFPDRKQILIGHSAGAHASLAQCVNYDMAKALIQGVILISGVYEFLPLSQTSVNEPLNLSPADIEELTFNEKTVISNNTSVLVLVGKDDSPYFVEMSQRFYENLKEKYQISFQIVKDEDHFSIIENIYYKESDIYRIISDFIGKI